MLGFAIAQPNLPRYTLNGRGERVGKTIPGPTPVTHHYAYDEAGHLLGQYVVGVKLTKGAETLYLDGTPVATTVGGSLSYLETDHLGTPRIAANPATNAQQWQWDFFANAFGDNPATVAPSGGINVPLRYPGQLFDAETGLHYNYFRDYEPGTGRYVESDPIGLNGGVGSYAYANNSSLGMTDFFGLRPVENFPGLPNEKPSDYLCRLGSRIRDLTDSNTSEHCAKPCKDAAGNFSATIATSDEHLKCKDEGCPANYSQFSPAECGNQIHGHINKSFKCTDADNKYLEGQNQSCTVGKNITNEQGLSAQDLSVGACLITPATRKQPNQLILGPGPTCTCQ